ncbi:MAG: hypothetical protein H6680_06500 [Desulfobacteraceae bacterium]|nr:hypothetical protein [Desulfobacteraceae bacterium]
MSSYLTCLAVISAFIFAVIFIYYGILYKVEVRETESAGFILVYQLHEGDYGKIQDKINSVYYFLKNNENILSLKGFALFLDNPLYSYTKNLKSLGGCVLPYDKKMEENLKHKKIPFFTFKGGKCIYSEFLFKGNFSHTLGLYKVYPKLFDFIKKSTQKPDTVLEIYDIIDKRIKYYSIYDFKKNYFESFFIKEEK